MTQPDLLTTAEVAGLFRVTEATVNRWVREGKIAALALPGGKGYRFRRPDVEALVGGPEAAA